MKNPGKAELITTAVAIAKDRTKMLGQIRELLESGKNPEAYRTDEAVLRSQQ
jgi:hypothetical protein